MFIVSLLLAAALAGILLWAAVRADDGAGSTAPRTTLVSPETDVETTTAGESVPVGDLRVESLSTFDPRGDGEENDDLVALANDGDTGTKWLTECYQNQYFGAKQGVGVVVKLNGPARGRLDVAMATAPWNVDVYTSDSPSGDLASWGDPVAQDASQQNLAASFSLDSEGRYVLLMLREASRDEGCSGTNPFRSGLAEVTAAS